MTRRFVLRLTHGTDDVERAGGALTVAATALASGIDVELWLQNQGTELARPGVVETLELPHSPPLIELWNAVVESGRVYACSQCMLRRSMTSDDLRPGVTQGGAAVLVASLAEEGAVSLDY